AAALTDRPAPVLADLAAAHLLRAERRQSPRDLLEAVEAAARAREADPASAPARWNLALALERLAVDGEAAEAWREYLAIAGDSGWAAEARRHLAALAALRADSAESPQQVSERGWEVELGAWGDAVLSGDSAAAALHLSRAEALGASLERAGRDATLAEAVRAIRARASDASALRALAAAHRDYARGRALYDRADYEAAGPLLERVAHDPQASEALRAWALLFRGATQVYGGDGDAGMRAIQAVASRADTLREPGLAGRAEWMLGTTLNLAGHLEEALRAYGAAERFFSRAGQTENRGAVLYLSAEVQALAGNTIAADELAYRALSTLRPYRASRWLHNQLQVAANAAAGTGLPRAALLLQNESLRVARATANPVYVAEALLGRAQLLTWARDTVRARSDLAAGRQEFGRVPDDARRSLEADYRAVEATLLADRHPRLAVSALDSVVASPAAAKSVTREILARLARADARMASGDRTGAAADLDRVIALVEQERTGSHDASMRESMADAARGVFDRMVMLQVRSGDAERALSYLERGREAFSPSGPGSSGTAGFILPRGDETAVEYALIGDTLLAWSLRRDGIRLTRTAVGHDRFIRTVAQLTADMESSSADAEVESDLGQLHAWLVAPIRDRLPRGDAELVVVADGEVSAVPFVALRHGMRDRYLIEEHPIRFAPTLRDALAPPAAGAAGGPVLVVEPGAAAAHAAGLPPLRQARNEAASVAATYASPRMLSADGANPATLRSLLGTAGVVHYAGHAVFDDERPAESYLALSPAGGEARLTAAGIKRLNLSHVRLVVLSACETQRAQARRSGGFTGLTSAFLRAGAAGVIGTLWPVDERAAGPLSVTFHQLYSRSGDATRALRGAQLRMIATADPSLRSPAAWAGFRYAGQR
ncbi:MAG: CHAT domain-containing protein, partial [Gemmatimonadetes bacterium]|nr:CHAT domain-containing protein [Gemmatimonadota bacterium]